MLSKVLKKEVCAECRFCCSFRRQSLWELPKLSAQFMEKYKTKSDGSEIRYIVSDKGDGVTDLRNCYRTDDPSEEVPCPFLDTNKGCILPYEDKPFECSAWPLRLMRMENGSLKVCLTPTCPAMNHVDVGILKEETASSWHELMENYAKEHPYIIMDYKEGYIPLE